MTFIFFSIALNLFTLDGHHALHSSFSFLDVISWNITLHLNVCNPILSEKGNMIHTLNTPTSSTFLARLPHKAFMQSNHSHIGTN